MFADSYSTISSCAFTNRVLDSYISHLYSHLWERQEATTQFQGNGSNHELAALLLTETIQHSLHTSKRPVYVLYLDAKSAFVLVLWQFLIKNLYVYGLRGQGLVLIDERLTVCEWNGVMMGLGTGRQKVISTKFTITSAWGCPRKWAWCRPWWTQHLGCLCHWTSWWCSVGI